MKSRIKHHQANSFCKEQIQATNVVMEDWNSPITIAAIYYPPKHKINNELFTEFFGTLGDRFIEGGDYNAKYVHWGSKLSTTKDRELIRAVEKLGLNIVSSGQPTYWPTDRDKIPDLIDFFISKGINNNYTKSETCLELSSDHLPNYDSGQRINNEIEKC